MTCYKCGKSIGKDRRTRSRADGIRNGTRSELGGHEFTLVVDVVENLTGSIGDWKLRLVRQCHGSASHLPLVLNAKLLLAMGG